MIDANLAWVRVDGSEILVWEDYLDDKGERQRRQNRRPADATTKLPILRPTEFYYTDFVNEGALTHGGMFSVASVFDGHSSAYASELFELVDRWRAAYQIELDELPAKVDTMVSKYIAARKGIGTMAKGKQFEVDSFDDEAEIELDAPRSAAETKADTSLEQSQKSLKLAEQLATSLSAGEAEIDNRSRFATADELALLQATVEAQSERIRELSGQVRKTAELLTRSMTALSAIQRNLLRMDGEQVTSVPVTMNGKSNGLEPLQFSHPQPGVWAANGKGGVQPVQTAEQRAIETQQRRAKAARG